MMLRHCRRFRLYSADERQLDARKLSLVVSDLLDAFEDRLPQAFLSKDTDEAGTAPLGGVAELKKKRTVSLSEMSR